MASLEINTRFYGQLILLPRDVLNYIISFLDVSERLRYRLVSRFWRTLFESSITAFSITDCVHDRFYEFLAKLPCLRSLIIHAAIDGASSLPVLASLKAMTRLTALEIANSDCIIVMHLMTSLTQLFELDIDIDYCCMNCQFPKDAFFKMTSLRTLSIKHCQRYSSSCSFNNVFSLPPGIMFLSLDGVRTSCPLGLSNLTSLSVEHPRKPVMARFSFTRKTDPPISFSALRHLDGDHAPGTIFITLSTSQYLTSLHFRDWSIGGLSDALMEGLLQSMIAWIPCATRLQSLFLPELRHPDTPGVLSRATQVWHDICEYMTSLRYLGLTAWPLTAEGHFALTQLKNLRRFDHLDHVNGSPLCSVGIVPPLRVGHLPVQLAVWFLTLPGGFFVMNLDNATGLFYSPQSLLSVLQRLWEVLPEEYHQHEEIKALLRQRNSVWLDRLIDLKTAEADDDSWNSDEKEEGE